MTHNKVHKGDIFFFECKIQRFFYFITSNLLFQKFRQIYNVGFD